MPFSLGALDAAEQLSLCRILWDWDLCKECLGGCQECRSDVCPINRLGALQPYFRYYQRQCFLYERAVEDFPRHADLFQLVKLVRSELHLTKEGPAQKSGDHAPWSDGISNEERVAALDLAAKVIYMVPCSTGASNMQDFAVVELGTNRAPWQEDSTFFEYFSTYFPQLRRISELPRDLFDLNAERLSQVGVTFLPTDDLSSHLKFNPKTMKIQIFHHGAFLKENLRLSKDKLHLREEDIRRQIYLEILDSTQKLLFPINSPKSFSILEQMVHKHGLDPSILSFESCNIRSPTEREPSYHFLASRIMDLYEEQQNPTPRGRLEEWFERRSGARYTMMATLIGVAFAVFLGFLSLGVSTVQAWIAWQAWKHPAPVAGS